MNCSLNLDSKRDLPASDSAIKRDCSSALLSFPRLLPDLASNLKLSASLLNQGQSLLVNPLRQTRTY